MIRIKKTSRRWWLALCDRCMWCDRHPSQPDALAAGIVHASSHRGLTQKDVILAA